MATERMTADEFKALKRRSKYRNKPTTVNGRRFASKREAARYSELLLLERDGQIASLRCQPRYVFWVNGVRIGHYTADFVYWDCEAQTYVVEDAKGYRVRDWSRTKKLMRACFGVEVREV